eukprot:2420621-Lingulodinium_polyedra.AAC.1
MPGLCCQSAQPFQGLHGSLAISGSATLEGSALPAPSWAQVAAGSGSSRPGGPEACPALASTGSTPGA